MVKATDIKDLKSVKDQFTLKGKKILVSGATKGLGMAAAAAFAELGADVAIVGSHPSAKAEENAAYIAKKFGVRAITIYGDVSKKEDVDRVIETMLAEYGTIDALFSNAGVISSDDNGDMPLESWKRMLDINLTGMFLMDQAVANYMKAHGIKGSIVNTGSMSGHIVNHMDGRQMVCYTTTKAGVIHLTKSFAMDYAPVGIRVNCVSPGTFISGIHDGKVDEATMQKMAEGYPMGRFGTLDEIVGIIAFLMTDMASFITGADYLVDGGYSVR